MVDLEHISDFETWYRLAHRQVLAALIAYAGDVEPASEATDEAFSRVLRDWETVRAKDSPTAWTFTIARNLLRRQIRRAAREKELREEWGLDAARLGRDHSDGILAALEVAQRLAALTPKQRSVVILHHGFDLSQERTAKLLGISRSTVASTLVDSRRILLGDATEPAAPGSRKVNRQ